MNEDDLKAITSSIEGKIGADSFAMIADDVGKLYTSNTQVLNSMSKMDNEIKTLKDTNEKLVLANGALLQQVPMASDYDKHQSSKGDSKDIKSFDFRSAFDSKGNFKRNI